MTDNDTAARHPDSPRSSRRLVLPIWVASVAALVVFAVVLTAVLTAPPAPTTAAAPVDPGGAGTTSTASDAPPPPDVTASQLAALPEAKYDAVIGGLLPFAGGADDVVGAFRLDQDAALFGADRRTPVARFSATDFLGAPSTVVVVQQDGDWSLVLTPARVTLPSASGGNAPAQSAAWVPSARLQHVAELPDEIRISTGGQSLTILHEGEIVSEFGVAVGKPGAPTPTGVTGYLQQRYIDPKQGEVLYPIQLTSLHATTKDEPYRGDDGGLIGIHFNRNNAGAISYGCVRLPQEAIEAVDDLPLGTPVTITE